MIEIVAAYYYASSTFFTLIVTSVGFILPFNLAISSLVFLNKKSIFSFSHTDI